MDSLFLIFVVLGALGLSALAAALWTYSDMRKGKEPKAPAIPEKKITDHVS